MESVSEYETDAPTIDAVDCLSSFFYVSDDAADIGPQLWIRREGGGNQPGFHWAGFIILLSQG